jgi:NAD(P)-dependent dehydrogenase (short-subunit alcohol dehydrogenase family)
MGLFSESFQSTVSVFGSLDIVICNAGVMNDRLWELEVDVNLVSQIIIYIHNNSWRMATSEMLRHAALVRSEISEELTASIIRVTIISELGTVLAVTSNCFFVTCVGC